MIISRRNLFRVTAAAIAAPALPFDAPNPAKRNMIVRSKRPEDLEMPLDGFATPITPIDRFFVRTHTYAPQVNLAEWKLAIAGKVGAPLTLTMNDLKRLPKFELESVLECAGNGRAFYEPTVPGLQWQHGAVGNARWTGVRLADVLKKARIDSSAKHLLFEGADGPPGTMPDFQRGIPVPKALDPNTMLAFEMNGQTLPMQHGYPLRLIVPGWAGDSWVKWITRIEAMDHESEGFFMKTAYRHPGKGVPPGSSVDPAQMQPVTSLRVKSVLYQPASSGLAPLGKPCVISGVAWGGDRGAVSRVDVSVDGGSTWKPAQLLGSATKYGFRQFRLTWTPQREERVTILARAASSDGDVQPAEQEWNPSGYLWNVMPRVSVLATNAPGGIPGPGDMSDPRGEWPQGFRQACLTCHESDVIEQQRLTKGQWEREIDKMVRWGSKVSDAERSPFVEYLSRYFRPKPR